MDECMTSVPFVVVAWELPKLAIATAWCLEHALTKVVACMHAQMKSNSVAHRMHGIETCLQTV
jgi:hypothetical protein